MNCAFHKGQKYAFICKIDHECQKKLCPKCLAQHKKEFKQNDVMTIEKFFALSQECLSQLDDQPIRFQNNFYDLQKKYNELFEKIRNHFFVLYNDLNEMNEEYKQLKFKLSGSNLENFTNLEINKIINALNTNIVNTLNFEKTRIREMINKTNQRLEMSLQNVLDKFNNFINRKTLTQLSLINDNLEYCEHKIFNFSHGECFYQIKGNNHIQSLAGTKKFNKKVGEWKIINDQIGKDLNLNWSYVNYDQIQDNQLLINIQNNILIPEYKGFLNFKKQIELYQFTEEQLWYEIEKQKLVVRIYFQGKQCGQWKNKIEDLFFLNTILEDSWGGKRDEQGQEQGMWIENLKGLQMRGFYKDGKKIGSWKTYSQNGCVENGYYNQKGFKEGRWKEILYDQNGKLVQYYEDNGEIQFIGDYKGGKRVGEWNIYQAGIKIGGGMYNQEGLKNGKWKEIEHIQYNQQFDEQEFFQQGYLFSQGVYKMGVKVGEWNIIYNGELIGGGCYNDDGEKNGKWRDIDIQQYSREQLIYCKGTYKQGIKVGNWKIFYKGHLIGCGSYNDQGLKSGKWKDIDFQYYSNCQEVYFEGVYNSGIKVGEWKIYFQGNRIGGGSYDEEGTKIGKWRDIDLQHYKEGRKFSSEGMYKHGFQVGEWRIYYEDDLVGGGSYNDKGEKHGQWKDIDLNYYDNVKQACFEGVYNQGIKVGEWKTCDQGILIGGGFYDDKGKKNGKWREIEQSSWADISNEGVYWNGIKVGEWKMLYDGNYIGGGSYNYYGAKIGKWRDVDLQYYDNSQKIWFEGFYNCGIKVGEWRYYNKGNLIGGGSYNDDGMKVGEWNDIPLEKISSEREYFKQNSECLFSVRGTYRQGVKVGEWKIIHNDELIGGGIYNDEGVKNGKWKDINIQNYSSLQDTYLEGIYSLGTKIGEWKIIYCGSLIGGGFYSDEGVKNGKWKDIEIQSHNRFQNHFEGSYRQGLRVGYWKLCVDGSYIGGGNYNEQGEKKGEWNNWQRGWFGEFRQDFKIGEWRFVSEGEIIGGGFYNNKGMKNGKWKDVEGSWKELSSEGTYRSGIKVGGWTTFSNGKLIGSGSYDNDGVQIGNWKDFKFSESNLNTLSLEGTYKKGIKVGEWKIFKNENLIGIGSYNEEGVKIGKWMDFSQSQRSYEQITFEGIYIQGIRVGEWKMFCAGVLIGGGLYDEGLKNGKWKVINVQCYRSSQNIYLEGIYKSGTKVGDWKIFYCDNLIGGGFYNDGIKNRKWKEIDLSCYSSDQQVSFEGFYHEGIKVGEWKTIFEGNKIGGGFYNNEGIKNGKWKDIDVSLYEKYEQTVFEGMYNQGIKVGNWNVLDFENIIEGGSYNEEGVKHGRWKEVDDYVNSQEGTYKYGIKVGGWKLETKKLSAGGGYYDDEGLKNGKWKEFGLEEYDGDEEISIEGVYRKGIKIGEWKIYKDGYQIGGGFYSDEGIKIGKWNNFIATEKKWAILCLVGTYKQGIKVGEWKMIDDRNQICGRGYYNDEGLKNGKWSEINLKEFIINSICFEGIYKQGIRVGEWKIIYEKNQIGAGFYNDEGVKNGKWKDIDISFSGDRQVCFEGVYQKGIQVGEWVIFYQGNLIGGGSYNKDGMKNGKWKDISMYFKIYKEVLFEGEYKIGIKVGEWKYFYEGNLVGRNFYNEKGIKVGEQKYIDLEQHERYRKLRLRG